MPVAHFNESFLGNADVPQTGTTSAAAPPPVGGRATGRPRAVDQADGLANLRADGVHTMAAPRNPNPGGTDHRPAAVASFNDRTV